LQIGASVRRVQEGGRLVACGRGDKHVGKLDGKPPRHGWPIFLKKDIRQTQEG
jgi:hypothetical protein